MKSYIHELILYTDVASFCRNYLDNHERISRIWIFEFNIALYIINVRKKYCISIFISLNVQLSISMFLANKIQGQSSPNTILIIFNNQCTFFEQIKICKFRSIKRLMSNCTRYVRWFTYIVFIVMNTYGFNFIFYSKKTKVYFYF